MWGWINPEGAVQAAQVNKLSDAEMKAQRAAQQKIEQEGKATCKYCEEDIYKNESQTAGGWTWESEYMLGFCEKSPLKNTHAPMVKWNIEDGVHNA